MSENQNRMGKQNIFSDSEIAFEKGPNSLANVVKRKTTLDIPDDLLKIEIRNLIDSGLVVPPYTQQVVASVIQYFYFRFGTDISAGTNGKRKERKGPYKWQQ